jgi:putative two-component system response regulator
MKRKFKLLIIDDDKLNRLVAKRFLEREFTVIEASSAAEGFAYLAKQTPDLMLLDIKMPDMDGFVMMAKLKQDVRLCRIPVIFLTADRSAETEEKCFQVGGVDYIAKPFVPPVLQMRVHRTAELEAYRQDLERMVEEQLARITQIQYDVILMMANLIESRDGTTGGHVKRAATFTGMLARRLREKRIYAEWLTTERVLLIERAAPLHDIGKIVIPDAVLQKPARLTDAEYKIIQSHAAAGAQIIQDNMSSVEERDFVQLATEIAGCHHEKWAGGGYPMGIKGEEIPLGARIMTVADVFDALSFKRQYKDDLPLDRVMDIMENERGTTFEPVLLDTFMEMRDELEQMVAEMRMKSLI